MRWTLPPFGLPTVFWKPLFPLRKVEDSFVYSVMINIWHFSVKLHSAPLNIYKKSAQSNMSALMLTWCYNNLLGYHTTKKKQIDSSRSKRIDILNSVVWRCPSLSLERNQCSPSYRYPLLPLLFCMSGSLCYFPTLQQKPINMFFSQMKLSVLLSQATEWSHFDWM